MKIGIEAQRIFRKKKHGMEIVTIKLIRYLQEIDKENEYVIFVKDGEDNSCIQETDNFKIILVPGFSYPDWEQIQLPRAIRKEKLDLIHFTSNTASVFIDIPMILTLHDIIYLESINFSGSHYQNFGNLYRRIIVPKVVKKCKKIITVSDYEKKKITNYFKIKDKCVQVIYNGKDSSFQKCSDKSLLNKISKKYNLPDNFILFLGNTAPKKNTKGLLKAYSKYLKNNSNPFPLVIVDLSLDVIINILEEFKIQDIKSHIISLKYISHKDMPIIYNLSKIFVYPSLRESFGLPIIEAMACGTPVITSNTSSMPEVAENAAILIDPHNPYEITDALSELTNNLSRREELIEKGFIQAKNFDWKKTAQNVLDIYNKTLN